MSCTPPHPNLSLDRPLTPQEMLDALAYEGMFGIGDPDLDVAKQLDGAALLHLDHSENLGWTVCGVG